MTELESFSVNNMGVQLRVYAMGPPHAPPLVALHGMQDVALSLRPVVDQLATDFRVYLPEMRGHGSSDRPGHYSMLSYVFDLHRVLDTLNLEAPMILGHSLGGQLAIRLAAMFPNRVKLLLSAESVNAIPLTPSAGVISPVIV